MTLRNQVSKHGNRLFLTSDNKTVSQGGFAAGGPGLARGNKAANVVLPGSPLSVAIFDDFLGPTVNQVAAYDTGGDFVAYNDDWVPAAHWQMGAQDTGQRLTKPVVAGGVARLTSSASSGQTPITGAMSLHGERNWKANQGGLRMAGRVKIEALSGSNVFIGLTDTGGGEMPVYDTGSAAATTLTPAADFVGFLYSGSIAGALLSRTAWRCVAGKAGVDQDSASTVTPVANVYDALEVSVDSSGNAQYFINGAYVTTLSNAVTSTVGLAPHFGFAHVEAAAKYADADWLNVSADRDTGE